MKKQLIMAGGFLLALLIIIVYVDKSESDGMKLRAPNQIEIKNYIDANKLNVIARKNDDTSCYLLYESGFENGIASLSIFEKSGKISAVKFVDKDGANKQEVSVDLGIIGKKTLANIIINDQEVLKKASKAGIILTNDIGNEISNIEPLNGNKGVIFNIENMQNAKIKKVTIYNNANEVIWEK